MEIGKWKMAQAWRHFKRPASSKGLWKQFVEDSKQPIQMAEGGVPQLVQPGPGRQGYQGVSGRTEFSKYDRYKNDPHTKANKIRTYLRSLKKGATIDTAKLMDKFGAEGGELKKLLDEAEFLKKDFKRIHSKREAYTEARIGKPRKDLNLTPSEMKHLEGLYSSKYKNLKGMKLVNAMYEAGEGSRVTSLVYDLRSGKHQGGIRDKGVKSAILEVYDKIKKQKKRAPHTVEIYKKLVGKFPNTTIDYVRSVLVDEGLKYTKWKPLIHGSKAERLREMKRIRLEREAKFSDPFLEAETRGRRGLRIPKFKLGPLEFKGMEIGGIHRHHMNSLRQNVNLRNVAYISGSDNWWLGKKIEGELGKIYAERETLLKEKSKGWKEKTNALNDKGRKILDKVPERLKGLINFEVVEVNPNGTLKKPSNIGMDWKVSAGAKAGKFGKMDFNKMTASQRKKAIKLLHQSYDDYRSARFTRSGAAGTLGGLGIGLGAVAAGAEYQQGKPLYDVFANLPLEFASFGMIPATEISQQLRIRGDLKDKDLSFAERNKKMALYNRAQAQEAIEQDVGDVGLESYALSGLGEGETKEQAYAVREDEDRELMERKINRGYIPEKGKWESEKFVDEVEFAEGGSVPRTGYKKAGLAGTAGLVGRSILGKAFSWVGADIGFYYLDKWNEMSKGHSEEEAAAIAKDNATLGLYKNKEYIKQLKKTAEEMGLDSRAFENVYKMNEKWAKLEKEHQRYQGMIEKLEGMEAGPERDARLEQITNAYNNWQESMDPEIRKWQQGVVDDISISKTGGIASPLELSKARESLTEEDWNKPFIDIQDVALEKLEKEKAAAYDMQSKQVNPEAGNIGDWLERKVFTLDYSGKKEEQERINDMLDFDPKELYRYNKARGLDPDNPLTLEAYQTLKSAHPGLGFREEDAGGGIAGLLKK